MALYSFEDFGKNEEIINYNNPDCINCNECCTMMANITEDEFNKIIQEIDSNKELRDFKKKQYSSYVSDNNKDKEELEAIWFKKNFEVKEIEL